MTTLDTIPAFPLPPPSPEPPTLLTLPFEIRHLILKYLLTPLTITPRVSTAISTASHYCSAPSTSGTPRLNSTTTSILHASPRPPPHPSLAILTTSRLLHAEALPLVIQHATLSLRTRTQNALLGKPSITSASTSASDSPSASTSPQKTLSRRPHLNEIRHLALSWPLLPNYPSAVLRGIFSALRCLRVDGIDVGVGHGALLGLWRERWARVGMLRDRKGDGEGKEGKEGGRDGKDVAVGLERCVEGEKKMVLLQALLCWLKEGECDLLLDILGAARARWRVEMGWRVGCLSCKRGEGGEAERGFGMGTGCVLGVLEMEVRVEL